MERTAEQYLRDLHGLETRHLLHALHDLGLGANPGGAFGEVYLERSTVKALSIQSTPENTDGVFRTSATEDGKGLSVRIVNGEHFGFHHSDLVTAAELYRCARNAHAIMTHPVSSFEGGETRPVQGHDPYAIQNSPILVDLIRKKDLLKRCVQAARAVDPRIQNVNASVVIEEKNVIIQRSDGRLVADNRPLIRLRISCMAVDGNRSESGDSGGGARSEFEFFEANDFWLTHARLAAQEAIDNLTGVPVEPGTMPVVLAAGWPGVLFHEAVGHPLENDSHFTGASAFAGMMGQMVASPLCTIVDSGIEPNARGSLKFDDEGNDPRFNVLIEKGRLVKLMGDERHGRLMGTGTSGNGRRQSYNKPPLPRMFNTTLMAGPHEPGEIIASVKKGIYATSFGGGQVDQATGEFVFSCTGAWMIRDGKIAERLKGVTLKGNGPTALKFITMVGNDPAYDSGVGTCGKAGQSVPVCVGTPTLRIENLAVGGR